MSIKSKVKGFQAAKGFGFILDPKGGADIFLLDKYCVDGRQPKQGDYVRFDKVPSEKCANKFEARNVTGGTGALLEAPTQDATKADAGDAAKDGSVPDAAASKPVSDDLAPTQSDSVSSAAPVVQEEENAASAAKAIDAKKSTCAGDFESMRSAYDELGSGGYYSAHGEEYVNPHEPALARALIAALDTWAPRMGRLQRVHDLACGSGEASAAFVRWSGCEGCSLDASDPYTFAAYEKRLGRPAYRWSFEEIAGGVLEDGQPYDLAIGSFCLHLLDKSYLHTTLAALARSCRFLIVLTPHKRPVIEPSTGWQQVNEILQDRIRVRLYASPQARRLAPGTTIEQNEYSLICGPPIVDEQEEDVQQTAEESIDIRELVSNMNTHELREALIKRGLSTSGKRSEWGTRLVLAVLEEQKLEASRKLQSKDCKEEEEEAKEVNE